MKAVILNTGLGNVSSVANAFRAIGCDARVSEEPQALREATHIVFPGVGSFGEGMRRLREGGWAKPLAEEVLGKAKPFLGICLGMQLLASSGVESGEEDGLGWIEGRVERIPVPENDLRLPHVGWNEVQPARPSRLFDGMPETALFYFVHSYHLTPRDAESVTARCLYGVPFAAAVESGNVCGVQFHPEKSQDDGLRLLRNFVGKFS